jgi:hypothetical protein
MFASFNWRTGVTGLVRSWQWPKHRSDMQAAERYGPQERKEALFGESDDLAVLL